MARHAAESVSYTSDEGRLVRVVGGEATEAGVGPVSLGPDGITCGDFNIPLDNIAELDIHSKNVLVFTADKAYYELSPSGNGYKYFQLYRHYAKAAQEAVSAR